MPRVPVSSLGSLVFAALAVLSSACDLSVEVSATMHEDEQAASSTTNPDPDRGSSEETTGESPEEGAASSSTTDEGEDSASTGLDESSSTGEPLLPDGAECGEGEDAGAACVSGVCGLGVCQPAAPAPGDDAGCDDGGGCNPGTACVVFESGVSCVPTGPDAEDGSVAPNDSPAGNITVTDLDMWDVVGPLAPGSYTVKLKASSYGALTVLDSSTGVVLAVPEQAIVPDDIESGFYDYPVTIGPDGAPDGAPGIVIAVSGTKPDALPYYLYMTGP